MKVNAGGRRAAGLDRRSLGASDIGDQCGTPHDLAQPREHGQVLRDRRSQHDQIGAVERGQIAAADGERPQLPRHQRDVVAIDADHGRVGKHAPNRERQRPADQPDAYDPDALEVAVSSHV